MNVRLLINLFFAAALGLAADMGRPDSASAPLRLCGESAMKFSDLAKQVRNALATWASAYGGTAEVAGDPAHVFAILAAKPGSVRACVFSFEENKRGDFEEANCVDRKLLVVISRGKGFSLEPGDSLLYNTTASSAVPLIDLVEEARDIVRGLSAEADYTEVTLDYLGFRPFDVEMTTPIDAYQLTFQLGSLLDAPGTSSPASAPARLHARLSGDITLADDDYTYPIFDTVVYQDGSGYNATTGLFTAPASGDYLCEVAGFILGGISVNWAAGFRNSVNTDLFGLYSASIQNHLGTVLRLTAGSIIKPYFFQSSGGPKTLISASYASWLKIHRL